mmetsp:Transcript_8035/g.11865  ORF Transcript_8035/g.11865 Transcript_8035/m.11865 type:complete len:122 (-) Transcript_8035:537-902(-)
MNLSKANEVQEELSVKTACSLRASVRSSKASFSSTHKEVGNFQKRYLDPGLWPELSIPQQVYLQKSCKELQSQLHRISFQSPECRTCQLYQKKQRKTEEALKNAVSLSNFLLKEICSLDAN